MEEVNKKQLLQASLVSNGSIPFKVDSLNKDVRDAIEKSGQDYKFEGMYFCYNNQTLYQTDYIFFEPVNEFSKTNITLVETDNFIFGI